jgi:hypothetical protein
MTSFCDHATTEERVASIWRRVELTEKAQESQVKTNVCGVCTGNRKRQQARVATVISANPGFTGRLGMIGNVVT